MTAPRITWPALLPADEGLGGVVFYGTTSQGGSGGGANIEHSARRRRPKNLLAVFGDGLEVATMRRLGGGHLDDLQFDGFRRRHHPKCHRFTLVNRKSFFSAWRNDAMKEFTEPNPGGTRRTWRMSRWTCPARIHNREGCGERAAPSGTLAPPLGASRNYFAKNKRFL